jgi:hypothetical protein
MRFGGADHHEGLEGVDPERMLLELTPNSLMLGAIACSPPGPRIPERAAGKSADLSCH